MGMSEFYGATDRAASIATIHRALDLGVGWVSILDPLEVTRVLDVPRGWELVAYLAVGYAAVPSTTPELVERGWERFDQNGGALLRR